MEHSKDGSKGFYPHSHFWIRTVPETFHYYFDAHSFTVSAMGVIASLVLFLFSLCVKWKNLFTFLPLYLRTIVSLEGGCSPLWKLAPCPLMGFLTKNQKILVAPPFKEKEKMKKIVYETAKKWANQIHLEADRLQQV